jgi:peroxiredoxin Q/BCP
MRGKTVLLYFQEGIDCQPCWDQMKDIQANWSAFQALHIDQMVSITSDPLSALQQKVRDEGLTIPVLSDPTLSVSQIYTANQYGMMGTSRDGHTFILVGPDGRIVWRADYGGSPNYTMDVPVERLLADLRAGILRLSPWVVLHHAHALNDTDSARSSAVVLTLIEHHLVGSGFGLPQCPWWTGHPPQM